MEPCIIAIQDSMGDVINWVWSGQASFSPAHLHLGLRPRRLPRTAWVMFSNSSKLREIQDISSVN